MRALRIEYCLLPFPRCFLLLSSPETKAQNLSGLLTYLGQLVATHQESHTSEETALGKEVRGLFQALTEGGCGGLIGPTAAQKDKNVVITVSTYKHTSALQESIYTASYRKSFFKYIVFFFKDFHLLTLLDIR